jgi:hypothetical protein
MAEYRIEQLAAGTAIPVAARLAEELPGTPRDPTGSTLAAYKASMRAQPYMMKWRGGVLIVSARSWHMEGPPVSQQFVRRLRRESRPGRYYPLATMIEAADSLSTRQLMALSYKFPVLAAVAKGQPALMFMARCPDLAEQAKAPGGLALTPAIRARLRTVLPGMLRTKVGTPEVAALILAIDKGGAEGKDTVGVTLRLVNGQGVTVTGSIFIDEVAGRA